MPLTDNYHASLSPDGSLVVTACGDTVCVWGADTGEKLATFNGHQGKVLKVIYAEDGKHICSTSSDRTCIVWRVPEKDLQLSERDNKNKKRYMKIMTLPPGGAEQA